MCVVASVLLAGVLMCSKWGCLRNVLFLDCDCEPLLFLFFSFFLSSFLSWFCVCVCFRDGVLVVLCDSVFWYFFLCEGEREAGI